MTEINKTPEAGINQTDYLKLFMQELTYQDPLKPIDNRDFMAQMAQFAALQEAQATNNTLGILTSMTSSNQSLTLLGKKVTINSSEQEGSVSKIEFPANAEPIIHVQIKGGENLQVHLADITSVWN